MWTHLGGTQFRASETQTSPCVDPVLPDVIWDFYITKAQIGNLSYKYNLDVKKDGVSVVAITDGPMPHTNRSSVTKELYEIVEIIVLELDKKLKDTLRFIQNLEGCNDTAV